VVAESRFLDQAHFSVDTILDRLANAVAIHVRGRV
jgi:hypothetical protein